MTEIQTALAHALSAMPDVFSAVQWGGRAYKLPGPGSRGTKKPLLLAHVWIERDQKSIGIAFKLGPNRAAAMTRKHTWIKPHSFRTLAPSGWITAEVRTKAQCKALIELLRESRAMHGFTENSAAETSSARDRRRDSNASNSVEVRRLDAVLRRKREEGWSPPRDDDFDA